MYFNSQDVCKLEKESILQFTVGFECNDTRMTIFDQNYN